MLTLVRFRLKFFVASFIFPLINRRAKLHRGKSIMGGLDGKPSHKTTASPASNEVFPKKHNMI